MTPTGRQATLALKLVTRHGRATPLIWLSMHKDGQRDARSAYEDVGLRRLAEVLPDDVKVTILAGFADTKRLASSPSWASTMLSG